MPHPHETEIRTFARATPFVPFTIVTTSGARYRVPSGDHIIFVPDTDVNGEALPEEQRPAVFQLFSRGVRYHWISLMRSRPLKISRCHLMAIIRFE